MQRLKMLGAALVTLAATMAIASASASALPSLLAPAGTTFTGVGIGGGTLETVSGAKITCAETKVEKGTVASETHLEDVVHFLKCLALGFPANGLGQPKEAILIQTLSLLCYINKAKKEVGALTEIKGGSVHLEVPALGVLLVITGAAVGKVTPVNADKLEGFLLTFEQAGGKQKPTKCEGVAATSFKTSTNEGAAEESGEAITVELKFSALSEIMA